MRRAPGAIRPLKVRSNSAHVLLKLRAARSIVAHQHTDFFFHPYQRDPADCASLDPQGLGGYPGCPAKDTDGDGLTDCYEENDNNPWTDPTRFNGAQVSLSDLCHADTGEQGLLYEDYDTREEIQDCLDNAENTETGVTQGGSSWPFPGGNICSLDWGLGVAFTDCRPAGLLHVVGYVNVTQPHERCWKISDGSTPAGPNLALAALLLDAAIRENPITAADGLVCTQFPQGIHRIEWVYEFKERPNHGLEVGTCDSSICDNGNNTRDLLDDFVDRAMPLLPPCAEGECGVQCPCDTGNECDSDSDCPWGVCGEDNGGWFGGDLHSRRCWSPTCETDRLSHCGFESSECGSTCQIECEGDIDCPTGQTCVQDAGFTADVRSSPIGAVSRQFPITQTPSPGPGVFGRSRIPSDRWQQALP